MEGAGSTSGTPQHSDRATHSAVHAQVLQHSQAAHAGWDSSVELVAIEPAGSTSGTPQHCAIATFSAAHAQACQDAVAARGAVEGAVVRGSPYRSVAPSSSHCPRRSGSGEVEVAQCAAHSCVVVGGAREQRHRAGWQGAIVGLPEPNGNGAAEAAVGQVAETQREEGSIRMAQQEAAFTN